ncbi:MAG: cobyrinate a,c-diamide synthase [Quisquiliibacterium sp.]
MPTRSPEHAALKGWLICAPHKSSGKTTVAVGLSAALREQGLAVQPFKKGPDYIDPMWLTLAAGRSCRNLDPYLAGWQQTESQFYRHASTSGLNIIEGNHGLHDGIAEDGSDSNAALAVRLELPALMVLDVQGVGRSIAPLVLGFQAFEPRLRFAGVILNKVGASRHEARLRQALERYTDVAVIGALGLDSQFSLNERHLGLIPANEAASPRTLVSRLAGAVRAGVDLQRLLVSVGQVTAAESEGALPQPDAGYARGSGDDPLRIAIARDAAFGFYYPDDLEALEAAGARLVPFDALRDTRLPQIDAMFIGGGFPEIHARQLQANVALRAQLRELVDAGLPTYAECGGLMYLARSISVDGQRFEMVGAIPGDAVMHSRPVGRGYVQLACTDAFPWPQSAGTPADDMLTAHEFHHSSLEGLPEDTRYAYRVLRGHGLDGTRDGIVRHNLLASYAHRRAVGPDPWPTRFVEFARRVRANRRGVGPLAA